MRKLNTTETALELGALPHWTLSSNGEAISREFVLADFMQAFAFMTQIAIAAEKHNHHPEWSNVYNQVTITWTTHDVDGLSSNDIDMAQRCDQAFAGYSSAPASA
jgi:4a-hydroxytetrahydrobiopterin dehydratase